MPAADCRDTGCPAGEECQSETDKEFTRYVCVCPAGFQRDANTKHCQPVSQSGLYVSHYCKAQPVYLVLGFMI